MTRFDPQKTQNSTRVFGPGKTNGRQSRLPVDTASMFRVPEPKQNREPQPEQMAAGPNPKEQFDRFLGLESIGPMPRQ